MNYKYKKQGFIFLPLIFALGGGLAGSALGGAVIGGTILGMTGAQLGFSLGMMGGSILGNIMFPPEHETPWPQLDNYPIQKSTQGPPIQIIEGTCMVAGTLIWEGDVHPYAIKQSSGGKGGDDSMVTGYGYKQSFLIDLGEGPGNVLKIWSNEKQLYPAIAGHAILRIRRAGSTDADVTIFDGDNNEGVKDLTGLDYGEWPHNILVFFNEYDLGTTNAKPNFTFEVGNYLQNCFIGMNPYSGNKIVAKASSDGLDTDFGDSGYIDVSPDLYPAYCMHQLSDGRILISHNYYKVSMYNRDGTLDESWGSSGQYDTTNVTVTDIKEDSAGNFYLMGGSIIKLDSDGNYVDSLTSSDYKTGALYDSVWDDDDKTRLIVCGVHYSPFGSYPDDYYPTMFALDVDNMAIDTSWDGNVPGHPGFFAVATHAGNPTNYKIFKMSDGGYVVGINASNRLMKVLSDGSGLDMSYGSSGYVNFPLYASYGYNEAKNPDQDGDDLYLLVIELHSGDAYDVLYLVDENGDTTKIAEWDSPSGATYHSVCVFNDKLILGSGGASPATYNVEIWTKDGAFESGFDVLNSNYVWWVVPDTAQAQDVAFAAMAKDILSSSRYGANFLSKMNVSTFESMEQYCLEQGFKGSLNIGEQKSWRDWLDIICAHFGGYYYETGGQLCLGAYRDQEAVFELSAADKDFVVDNTGPAPFIKIKEREESETYNRIKVAWTNRADNYTKAITVGQDESDQRRSGTVREKTFNLPGIMTESLAQRMAWRLLFESMYRFKIYTFTITYKNMLIEAGDVGTISDGNKIDAQKVRMLRIDEDINGRGLACIAIEDVSELYPDIGYTSQQSLKGDYEFVTLEDAEINYYESPAAGELYLCIAPAGKYVNGWYIYKSYDDTTYQLIGRCGISGVTGGAANSSGTIQSNLPAHDSITWSPKESAVVSIGTVTDLHTDISETQFWNDLRLARIGDEIIAFRDAEETSIEGIWKITCLRRGIFGTEPKAHSSGEAFSTLDPNFTYKFSESDIGKTLYFKAVTFYGDMVQDISSLNGQGIEIEGLYARPAPASMVRLSPDENQGGNGKYSGDGFTLYWNLGSRVSGFNYGDWLNLPWNNYIADPELQAIVLKFETEAGSSIGQREITVGTFATITKATDLGGNDRAVIRVVPRRVYGSKLENSILVEDIS